MYLRSIYQEIKVLSCFEIKKSDNSTFKWKVTCLREFNSFKGKDSSFSAKSFEETKIISNIKLKKGSHLVLLNIEEDVDQLNGKTILKEEIISLVSEDWLPGLKGFTDEKEVISFGNVIPIRSLNKPPSDSESFKFKKSDLEFDYLSVIAQMNNYSAENPSDRRKVCSYLFKMGLELTTDNVGYMAFENKDVGIRAFFSNYRSNRKELGFSPSLKIEFTGHFFMRENADLVARKILISFTKKFGALFHVSRVDICQDIYGAYTPFDYFPNFLNKDKHHWSLRSDPNQSFYHDKFSKDATGFNVSTSRYAIVSYNRNIAIDKKYSQGKITREYYEHYREKYKDENVQRLEVRLLQKDACSDFYKMFMHESYSKERTLSYSMANFGRNHVLRDVGDETRESRYKENEVFAELFHLKERENFKIFRNCLEVKVGIKFNEMLFSLPENRLPRNMRNFGKSFCLNNSNETIEETLKGLHSVSGLGELTSSIESHQNIKDDRISRLKKSLDFFNLNEEDLLEVKLALNRGYNIAMSYG